MAAANGCGQEREMQKTYWVENSADLTVEAMMLDSKASDLDKEERPEVLSMLPPYEGKSVMELGAGIGRFTGELAQKAGQLIAMDFIDNVIKKNESINGHHKNVKFLCADVTSPDLNISDESVDLIFSNWLLMYLSDKEVENLAERMMKWLKVGGHIFFRESCFHQSGDSKRKYNPTHYREPRFYTRVFKGCHMPDSSGNFFELSLVSCKCIGAYVRNKKNQNQICWIWQKVLHRGFVSTGGIETTKEFVSKLELKPGQKVLDVGCGIGGRGLLYGHFEVADCTTKKYPDNTFDVIYSRDTILHIQDKPALFRSFYKWLKPGGKHMARCLRTLVFMRFIAEDRTDQFKEVLQRELNAVEKDKDAFIEDF
ncbi:hypothetical protein M0R45_023019 [Rubus argutus]|uniref:phosphoethanolamine N-methyltransferase n=1 Tax=Rubus argutus TaxID=59490 RepID=A0AAW1WQ61_RUBAR